MRVGLSCAIATVMLCSCGETGDAPQPPASLETTALPRQLVTVAAVDVIGRAGPGNTPFRVARREDHITQHPCTACHEQAVVELSSRDVSQRWSHMDIQLQHADALRCGTCHDYDDLGSLHLIDSDPVAFDHSYQVCAQCHSPQARDWAGGAHGKRLGGWRGERVIENCTGCHDPHAPAFPVRMPLLYPQVPRTGSRP